MATPIEILAGLPMERLKQVVESVPRKVREELYRSAGIRTKTSTFSLRGADKSGRVERLKAKLEDRDLEGSDAAEEVIRAYLGQRPGLLGDALDHLEVPHRQGLTDADLDFLEKLAPNRVEALWRYLAQRGHPEADIEIYARYMGIPEGGRPPSAPG